MSLLKVLRYLNGEDLNKRIGRSIIRYKGKYVWASVPGDGEDLCVNLQNVLSGEQFDKVHSSDEALDVSAFPLGYMNKRQGAIFTARMPIRINRQGLCSENAVWYQEAGEQLYPTAIRNDDLKSKAFFEMLNDEYGKFPDIIKNLTHNKSDEPASIAFSRRMALSRDNIGLIKLLYLTKPIAVYEPKSKEFRVSERFAHYLPILSFHGIKAEVA